MTELALPSLGATTSVPGAAGTATVPGPASTPKFYNDGSYPTFPSSAELAAKEKTTFGNTVLGNLLGVQPGDKNDFPVLSEGEAAKAGADASQDGPLSRAWFEQSFEWLKANAPAFIVGALVLVLVMYGLSAATRR